MCLNVTFPPTWTEPVGEKDQGFVCPGFEFPAGESLSERVCAPRTASEFLMAGDQSAHVFLTAESAGIRR